MNHWLNARSAKQVFLPLLTVLSLFHAGASRAADLRGFHGGDLAVVHEPYVLHLPAPAECEVDWGDGKVDKTRRAAETPDRLTHVYGTTGVAVITVKMRQDDGTWAPVPVDFAARMEASRPVFFSSAPVRAATVLANLLPLPADSFSAEFRVRLEDSAADLVFFGPVKPAAGACRFGLRNQSLYFELAGAGVAAVSPGIKLADGKWHHLAVTYDRVPLFPRANQVRFFVDGLPAGTSTVPAVDAGAVHCPGVVVAPEGFKGRMEALAVYDHLLFPLTILEHARAMSGELGLPVTVAHRGSSAVRVEPPVITWTVDVVCDAAPGADNGPTLRKALASAAAGTRLRLVGAANAGGGGTFPVRSLVEANKWASLVMENKTDCELDGNGSTLVFSEKVARYLLIDRCQRVAVRNLGFDLDPAYARVGVYAELREVDPVTRTVRARLINGRDRSPDPVIPRRASYWRWRPHDPHTLRIGSGPYFNSDSYAERPAPDPAGGAGALRFTLKQESGDRIWEELKTYAAGANFFLVNNADFSANAVSLMGSSHVTFEQVRYHATLGMVFLASDVDHLRVARCEIGLPPGQTAADRPLSAGADGYHFHQMRGDILFEGNKIALTDDDPVSIKDSIWPGVRKVGDRQLSGGKGIRPGSPVELLHPDYRPAGFTAAVTAVEGEVLTLDRPLPTEVRSGSLLMDRSHHTMNWVLRDNHLHDFYGRVMLYADHGTVVNNRIHGSYYHLGNSTASFETAGACRNVITHRNYFESTSADSSNWGGNQSLPCFYEITYSANSFSDKGLSLNNAAGSLVARNWFHGREAKFSAKRCIETKVLNNAYCRADAAGFTVYGTNSTDTVIEGNLILGRE